METEKLQKIVATSGVIWDKSESAVLHGRNYNNSFAITKDQ